MGFSNVTGCASIYNYEMAQRHWDRTPLPGRPGSILRDKWTRGTPALPLDDEHKWHYRLEQDKDSFGVYLYHKCMARYFKPEADGSRLVQYTHDSRQTSSAFMWRVTKSAREMRYTSTEGERVVVPVSGDEGRTSIWLDADQHIIVAKSEHAPVYRYVTSTEQKNWRKAMRESMSNMLLLLETGADEMVTTPSGDRAHHYHPGRPFGGNDAADKIMTALRGNGRVSEWDGILRESTTHAQVDLLRELFEACKQGIIDGSNAKPVAPKDISRSMMRYLQKLCPYQSAREPLPMFGSTLPIGWSFY